MNHPSYFLEQYFTGDKPCLTFNIEDIHHQSPYDNTVIHRHDYYEVYLFTKGGGQHTIEFDSYEVKDLSVSMVFPRQFHQLTLDKEAKGKVIMFNEELFCSEMLQKELRAYCVDLQMRLNDIQLDEKQHTEIEGLFDMVANLFKDLNILKKEQVRHMIKLIVLNLMDITKSRILSKKEATDSNLFLEFTNMVDSQYKELRLVNEYSEVLGLSTKKLNALAKKYRGETALQVIHDRIFLEAKRLLTFSGLTHKEIAYELKFDSPSAFNKFIHTKTQWSPSELQANLTKVHKRDD